jgi:hypothetical protein
LGSICFVVAAILVKESGGCIASLFLLLCWPQRQRFFGWWVRCGIYLAAELHRLCSGVFVWGVVSSFWGSVLLFWWRQCCLFGGIVVLVAAAVFLGGGFPDSFCLAAVLHCLLERCFRSWFGGRHLYFGGGVLLFWQMGCFLFGGGGIMVRT